MPPFHSRSTGSVRMARMTSFGAALAPSRPSSARASADSATYFAERGNTPPPREIFRRS